ncbi:MAG: hypothetical protein QXD03_02455 [Candidatus Anstonellales archaeon]
MKCLGYIACSGCGRCGRNYVDVMRNYDGVHRVIINTSNDINKFSGIVKELLSDRVDGVVVNNCCSKYELGILMDICNICKKDIKII